MQAALVRYHTHLHEAFVHAQRAELRFERSSHVHTQSFAPHTFFPKHTGTGHLLAPGYEPMTASEMGQLVTAMAEVYREVAAMKATEVRKGHRWV